MKVNTTSQLNEMKHHLGARTLGMPVGSCIFTMSIKIGRI